MVGGIIYIYTERFPSFADHSSVRNIGVVLDNTLTFSEHVANLTRSSYFHLRRLRAIRRLRATVKLPGIYVTLFACLPLPYLFVRYAHLTVMISLSRECGLLWLRHKPLQSLALRLGTNSFHLGLLDPLY